MANLLADVATAAALRHVGKSPTFPGTTVLPIQPDAASRRRYASLDVHATMPALLEAREELTFEEWCLIEEARRAFAKDARRLHRLKSGNHVQNRIMKKQSARLAIVAIAQAGQPDPRPRREQITDAALAIRLETVARAHAAELLKLRVAYRIPLHEWADALARVNGVAVLLEVYAPDAERTLPARIAPRCPPWASRRYRRAAAPTPANPFFQL